jgi:pimeloyl-ACP methyl ester carboxylesterase
MIAREYKESKSMSLHKLFLSVVFQSILLVTACSTTPNTATSPLVLTDCTLSSPGIPNQVTAKCGTLAVPENPSNPQGRRINLNIAVVPAVSRGADADPLFVLAGGPGQSIVETFPAMYGSLYRIHEKRDIVLVDQRGTGKSNPLRCLNAEDEALDDEQAIALLKECPKTLDADLKYYTTDLAMQDLDQVRAALGYQFINLYGVSYGTRAALTYLKMYPKQVRSVVLDAVVDPAFVLYQDAAQDGQKSLDFFLTRCEADQDCASAYPKLREELDSILEELDKTPAVITIPHPNTAKSLELTVTKAFFTNMIFNTLYSPDLVALLPLSIHQAYTEKNYTPLVAQAYLLNGGVYDGMFYAVACSEDAPLLSPVEAKQAGAKSIFGDRSLDFIEVCNAWTKGNTPPILRAPVSSDIPVLILSGEADPITPPWHAGHLSKSLPNSLHLIFKGMGHGNATTECATRILNKFIESATIKELDTSCVKAVTPPPFFVDFSGPQP